MQMLIEKPYRQRQSGAIEVLADPDDVFALMCPVREYEWEPDWRTNLILSTSGLVEQDCVFTTPAGASEGSDHDSAEAVWAAPLHDPKARRLVMIKFTPGECVTRLDIDVHARPSGAAVNVSYEHTALTIRGRKVVDEHTTARFDAMMAAWKSAIEGLVGPQKPAA